MSDAGPPGSPLFDLDAPRDAGSSYLGAYTLGNPLVTWLIGRAPELVAEDVSETSRAERPPLCPQLQSRGWGHCNEPMQLRARPAKGVSGSRGTSCWVCYRHTEPHEIAVLPAYPRAPAGDVLSGIGR
jgi:hypothetical protein